MNKLAILGAAACVSASEPNPLLNFINPELAAQIPALNNEIQSGLPDTLTVGQSFPFLANLGLCDSAPDPVTLQVGAVLGYKNINVVEMRMTDLTEVAEKPMWYTGPITARLQSDTSGDASKKFRVAFHGETVVDCVVPPKKITLNGELAATASVSATGTMGLNLATKCATDIAIDSVDITLDSVEISQHNILVDDVAFSGAFDLTPLETGVLGAFNVYKPSLQDGILDLLRSLLASVDGQCPATDAFSVPDCPTGAKGCAPVCTDASQVAAQNVDCKQCFGVGNRFFVSLTEVLFWMEFASTRNLPRILPRILPLILPLMPPLILPLQLLLQLLLILPL
jgi:hypothetical protein